ncbi:MAG: phospho-N-acetylmuramoyl-pentapeptide-transferase, partial [Propionibacterium sp.]|nr:phospho-N-acetylmuramoyl-pentapeptide-transferase [Propionibacterium sp.]
MKTILLAGVLAMIGTLLGTRLAISLLVRRGYGQFIRDDGPTSH